MFIEFFKSDIYERCNVFVRKKKIIFKGPWKTVLIEQMHLVSNLPSFMMSGAR